MRKRDEEQSNYPTLILPIQYHLGMCVTGPGEERKRTALAQCLSFWESPSRVESSAWRLKNGSEYGGVES